MLRMMFEYKNEEMYRYIYDEDEEVTDDTIFVLIQYPKRGEPDVIHYTRMNIRWANNWYMNHKERDEFHVINDVYIGTPGKRKASATKK